MAMSCCLGLMSNFNQNLTEIKKTLGKSKAKIICASKYIEADSIRELFHLGVTDFGENRTEALLNKKQTLKDLNITWHFIGHLQTNKVKSMINEIDYLHSLDSIKLAKMIQTYRDKPLKCFIEINVLKDLMKTGIYEEYLDEFIQRLKKYDKIEIVGFMAMGKQNNLTKTDEVFKRVNLLKKYYKLPELSIGMSDDYQVAIENGATMVRIGRLLTK